MKQAIIIHGWEGSPKGNWFPWLKLELENRGYTVDIPEMPNSAHPIRNEWLKKLQDVLVEPNEESLIVGHSLGCITALQYADSLRDEQKVGQIILVAGFIRSLANPETDGFFIDELDCENVKWHVSEIVQISSDNDPYVPRKEAKFMQDHLETQLLELHDAGHINKESGYVELPQILAFV